jgi:hypothetical protein
MDKPMNKDAEKEPLKNEVVDTSDKEKSTTETLTVEAVKHKKKPKKRKKRLFKLAAMEELVAQNAFLTSRYELMSVDAEEKLGYHYNETIHNILFNKYVKTDEKLMDRYMNIRKNVELEQSRNKKDDGRTNKSSVEDHPALAASTPAEEPVQDSGESTNVLTPEIESEIKPVDPKPDYTDPNEPIDTRVVAVNEMDSGDAGDFSYETPFFMHDGPIESWEKKWNKKNKKSKNNMKVVKPNTKERTVMGEKVNTLNENILTNPDMVDSMFEEYFGLEPETKVIAEGEKLPDTVVQVKRLHDETKSNSLGYYKEKQSEIADYEAEGESGGDENALTIEDVPMHKPSDDQAEFVKLNRGGNLMDRAMQGIDGELDAKTEARWKEQAGEEAFKNAEDKKKEVEKVKPHLAPSARVKSEINESLTSDKVKVTAMYKDYKNSSQFVVFDATKAETTSIVSESMIKLETKALGNFFNNKATQIIESAEFYIDLGSKKVYKMDKSNMLNESVSVNKTNIDKIKHLMSYSPSAFVKGR